MKKIFVILFAATAFLVSCSNTDATGQVASTEEVMNKQQRVSKETFKAFLAENKDVQLIDVRTAEEHNAGTIEGAKNMDFYGSNFKSQLESLDKDKPVMIFCKSGGRSGQTLDMMKEMGFSTVLELEGGYSGWE